MSISISNVSSAFEPAQPSPRRQQEDIAGRQLEQALQSGDLAGAQQAYAALSAFGANNSGPFSSPKLSSQFAAVGQALQAGDVAGAKQAADQVGKNLLRADYKTAKQDFQQGGWTGAQKAIANLEGDLWAVTGKNIVAPQNPDAATSKTAPAINVQV